MGEIDFSIEAMDDVPKQEPAEDVPPVFLIDDTHHQCTWRGKKQASVNKILKRAARKFNPWVSEEEADEVALARMERGKRIHKVLELFDKGKLDLQTTDPFYCPYLSGWIAACKELGINSIDAWTEIELPRYKKIDEKRLIFGIPDRIAFAGDAILDFKSSHNAQESYGIAVAGYCWMTGAKEGILVYVNEHGEHKIKRIKSRDHRRWAMALELTMEKKP